VLPPLPDEWRSPVLPCSIPGPLHASPPVDIASAGSREDVLAALVRLPDALDVIGHCREQLELEPGAPLPY